jgi:hypothetical protein
MNKDNYKKSLDQLEISPDFNERTSKLMKEARSSRQKSSPMTRKLVYTFASAAILISAGTIALNYGNLFPAKEGTHLTTEDSAIQSEDTASKGITVPVIKLPDAEASGIAADMIGLFVYQGRIYQQSNTALVMDENYVVNKDDMMNLRGDYLGKTKGSINEWSKQEDYATEFASTIGESEIYTVKGYDSKNRLMVYSEYEDGSFGCQIYDSFGGDVLTIGADYFDVLHLQDNIVSYQWESFDSWNYGKGERTDATINDGFQQFIDALYTSTPMGDMFDMFTENVDYDSQKFIYVKTRDNLITSLRLFKGGYLYAPMVGFFKMDQNSFDTFWNSMPVTAPAEVTETPTDTSFNASDIEVSLDTSSYPVDTDSISLTIKNNGSEEVYYGVDYSLEKSTGETWEVVPATKDLVFIDLAQILDANSEQEFIVDLSQLDPRLDDGLYRIVKNINGEPFYAKFKLTK